MRSQEPFRVMRRALDWELSAADVLRLVRADPHPVALLGAWAGGSDIVASDPVRLCCAPEPAGDVLDAPLPGPAGPSARAGAAFGGGWIGYLGFGMAEKVLPVPPAPGEPRQLPAWWFGYYDHVLRRDRATGRWAFEALWTPGRGDALERRFNELAHRHHAAGGQPRGYSCGTFRLVPSADEHRSAIRQAISYIRRGDIFQANICLRLEARFAGDPLDVFCRAVTRLDPPYAGFMRTPAGAVASLSPEMFLRRTGTSVWSQPIKGTRSRPADERLARRQREVLERSAKDRAENMMIVDLMRNDLSRVCTPGSVQVPAALRAEAHPGVWHLVSDIRGTLRAGAGDGQLIAAAFPPGSVTGAPKVRALEIIHELEATPREVYTGAVGYRSPVAGLELNVAIRTFEFGGDRVWLGSGGGIVADSTDADEYSECLLKATPLIRALNATLREGPGAPPSGPASGHTAIPPSLRPRPALGAFTSLCVADGYAHDLDRHLARLDDSTWQLFGKHLPPSVHADLAACLARGPSGRLRVTARPVGGPLQVTVEVIPAGPAPEGVVLHPATIPGGLGAHKWLDRRLLARMTSVAGLGPDEHLLIQDRSGEVLETDRGNVFAVIDGVLHTPPAEGKLLPGVTRAAVLRLAECDGITTKEMPISRQRLLEASEVFVTNSVQGVVPVRSLAGTRATWAAGPVASRLRAAVARTLADVRSSAVWPVPGSRSGRNLGRRAGHTRPAIVLVDNYDSFTYNLAHLLLGDGCQVEVVRNDEVSARDISDFGPDGIVISPGPGGPADAGVSIDTVRLCAATTPLLGICLGHQAIAAAYGARISTAQQPVHGQASPITHDDRGVLSGLPQRFHAARYHSLLVDEKSLPPGLLISARGPGGIPMGLRHAWHPAEGLQFHPESILTTHGNDIIRNFVCTVRSQSL
ncbi:MAG: para-aminobenzoate synthetase / 4-amino-4-deoxychorismate lyase [Streptosporangiaceae bacterium]|nr:para-aminobenzoate synthetase / 4-amino-4-deoxychorismate lyase [Streptosporangiaceae bacterium]